MAQPDFTKVNPEFDRWAKTLGDKHWARYDMAACRMGWEAACSADSGRLDHLEKLIQRCPGARFIYCDDLDEEDPMGFSIRIDGCQGSLATAPTFREAIDLDISLLAQQV